MVEDVDQSGAYRYQRPQYFSAFLHSARLPLSIREVLVQDVFPKLSLSSDENFSHMDTIFFDVPKAEQGDVSPTPSFKKVLSSL